MEIVTTTTTTPPASTNKTLYKISEEKSKGGVTSSRSRDYEEEISVRPVLLFQPFLTSTNRFNYITTNYHNQQPPALTLHTTTLVTTTHHNQPFPTQPCSYAILHPQTKNNNKKPIPIPTIPVNQFGKAKFPYSEQMIKHCYGGKSSNYPLLSYGTTNHVYWSHCTSK